MNSNFVKYGIALIGIVLLLWQTCREGRDVQLGQKSGLSLRLQKENEYMKKQIDSFDLAQNAKIVIHDTFFVEKRIYATKVDSKIIYIDTSKNVIISDTQYIAMSENKDKIQNAILLPTVLHFQDSFFAAKVNLRRDSQFIDSLTFFNTYTIEKKEVKINRDSTQKSIMFVSENPYTNLKELKYVEQPRLTPEAQKRKNFWAFIKGVAFGFVIQTAINKTK